RQPPPRALRAQAAAHACRAAPRRRRIPRALSAPSRTPHSLRSATSAEEASKLAFAVPNPPKSDERPAVRGGTEVGRSFPHKSLQRAKLIAPEDRLSLPVPRHGQADAANSCSISLAAGFLEKLEHHVARGKQPRAEAEDGGKNVRPAEQLMPAALDAIKGDRPPGAARRPIQAHDLRGLPRRAGCQWTSGRAGATIDFGQEPRRALGRPDIAARASKSHTPTPVGYQRIRCPIQHDNRQRPFRSAAVADAGRHIGYDGAGAREQLGGLAEHAEGHHSTVRDAGKVDARGIGDTVADEPNHELAQEAHIVDTGNAASLPAIVPNAMDAVRKHRGKAVRGGGLGEARAAHG